MNKQMRENMERQYREALKYNIERTKKIKRKEKVVGYLTIVGLLAIVVVCLICIGKLNNDFVEDCMKNGHSENYCLERA